MKKIICSLAFALTMGGLAHAQKGGDVKVAIDLTTIKDDKVMVTVTPAAIKEKTVTYYIPKTVPGTYSDDDYGQFIEGVKAYDKKGKELTVTKGDVNSWKIDGANKLAKLTYLVNDTYDNESERKEKIFSPSGSNIAAGTNIMLNTHAFVGYFSGMTETPYDVTISHPAMLTGFTSMVDLDKSDTADQFKTSRYLELTEYPIMYTKPDFTTFNAEGMDITIAVYSPNGKVTAKDITPMMEKTMRAQKKFLGAINSNKKYTVLVYLSDMTETDASGFGALEHPTCTTVVMPETMGVEALAEQLKDIVSHEFFHIVTPLSVHSKEIQFFDFNAPKMSEHLWMYEGVTEYFANLFQVNQGLIDEDAFFIRMAEKIANAGEFDDTMPFTVMSKGVLAEPYKKEYRNVYEKGALIAMCVDIIIREESKGQKGILTLMRDLTKAYGNNKPFDDAELFGKITELTYPEVGEFLKTYVAGPTPIPYAEYFAKVGVTPSATSKPGNPFLKGMREPLVGIDQTKAIFVRPDIEPNVFFTTLGIQKGDVLLAFNEKEYNLDNINDFITTSLSWKDGDAISVKIKRDGKEQVVKGKIKLPTEDVEGWKATDASKAALREAWLKG
ncbi:peptidase M61 [Flavobacterium sp. RHBU_24]|uniref:M61 family metallopeptidase n=1 Tax=Flavobacterium sp. RHBU_24 TaxID=3391185 RepID=UPI0039849713